MRAAIFLLKRYRWPLLTLGCLAALGLGGFWLYAARYPYGRSHYCIKFLMLTLEQYADDHDGRYPAGQGTPEASLSLLHREPYGVPAETLGGKTVPAEVARSVLGQGGLLGPDSCGWHYVEGLTHNDDRRLALLWDKAGLGHFGERHFNGSREVVLVGGELTIVSGAEWPAFLQEQRDLLARRDAAAIRGGPVLTATIRWPTGEVADHHDGPFRIEEQHVFSGGKSKGTARKGDVLRASDLKWRGRDLGPIDGVTTWVLWLPGKRMRSRPVEVRVSNGRPSPPTIVFEMEQAE
jgi:hypothetical protein